MSVINFEINKILSRRYSLVLLLVTIILFPAIVKVISYLNVVKDNVPEGLFTNNVAFGIITYTQTYFFLPVWIIVLVGHELTNGHVNRVIFTKSRNFYFVSKLSFCGIVTILFSFLGTVALVISVKTSPFTSLPVNPFYYLQFLVQLSASTLLFCILLMGLVFIIRSPIKTFVVYFIWTFTEGILFSIFEGIYNIELKWLPLHLVRTLYLKNGEAQLNNYYNPFVDNFELLIAPFGFILLITIITYKLFLKTNLPALSD
jgi:hypothetical protein